MDEAFDLAAYLRATKEMREAVNRVTGIAYEMIAADFSTLPDSSAFARVWFEDGKAHYAPISAEEFYENSGDGVGLTLPTNPLKP